VRPVWRRIWFRIESRVQSVEAVVHPLEARVSQFETGWRQYLPSLLNAVSSIGAFGHELSQLRREATEANLRTKTEIGNLNDDSVRLTSQAHDLSDSIAALWDRIAFVRQEVLLELKYGSRESDAVSSTSIEPRNVEPEKIAAAIRSGIRINLGCGHIPLDGYINSDRRELPGVDLVADVDNLGLEAGTVRELHSAHLIEHFPQELLRRRLLPYWRSLLAPGGVFRAVVPDGQAMLAGVAAGSYPFDDFREVLFGGQDYDGDFHYNLLTPDSFSALLLEANFEDIEIPVRGRKNGKCFEFEIRAIRGK
jgi:hypothetical protein